MKARQRRGNLQGSGKVGKYFNPTGLKNPQGKQQNIHN